MVVLKLTSVKRHYRNILTPTGELPLHLHIEVLGLESNKTFFVHVILHFSHLGAVKLERCWEQTVTLINK